MAKRPTVYVDEDYLKEIMANNIIQQPKKEEKEIIVSAETKELAKPTRKKQETQNYETLFLEHKASVDKRQIYVSSQLCEKINSFLPVIAGHRFGITSYINNILVHHLEQYKVEINELYEQKSQKPF
jgi:hypothetical protein